MNRKMKIESTAIPDVKVITQKNFEDSRGFFMESYHEQKFREAGIDARFVQDNHSSSVKGVLRGLHFQNNPYAQTKLIRVIFGEIFDVAVDLRKNSPSYGKWVSEYLSSENKKMMFIPSGFAHGFLVISDIAEIIYKCTDFYMPSAEGGIIWNDPRIGIEWPLEGSPLLSDKDASLPLLRDIEPEL